MARKRIFIHTGMPKTATTSIQNVLMNGHEDLRRAGWWFPFSPGHYSKENLKLDFLPPAHSEVLPYILEFHKDYPFMGVDWADTFVSFKNDSDAHTMIISHESISMRTDRFRADVMAEISEDADLHFIVTLRQPFDYILSHYKEAVWGVSGTQDLIEHWGPSRRYVRRGYARMLAEMQAFGQVHIIDFDAAREGEGIVPAFLEITGGSHVLPPQTKPVQRNVKTLCRDGLILLQRSIAVSKDAVQRDAFARMLGKIAPQPATLHAKDIMPPELVNDIRARWQKDRAEVARIYGVDLTDSLLSGEAYKPFRLTGTEAQLWKGRLPEEHPDLRDLFDKSLTLAQMEPHAKLPAPAVQALPHDKNLMTLQNAPQTFFDEAQRWKYPFASGPGLDSICQADHNFKKTIRSLTNDKAQPAPARRAARCVLSQYLSATGQHEQALKLSGKLALRFPDVAQNQQAYLSNLLRAGQYDNACQVARDLIRLVPNAPYYQGLCAVAAARSGAKADADIWFARMPEGPTDYPGFQAEYDRLKAETAPDGANRRIIAFSLFGEGAEYIQGAFDNIEAAKEFYPEWQVRIYLSHLNAADLPDQLRAAGAEVEIMTQTAAYDGLGWRFLPASDPTVDRFLVRDIDTVLSARDKAAVDHWMSAGKNTHVIRDHPGHNWPMLAGLWGGRGGICPEMPELMMRYGRLHGFQDRTWDQDFLWRDIYPCIQGSLHVNSEFAWYEGETPHSIPLKRDGSLYLGFPADRGELSERRLQMFEQNKHLGSRCIPFPKV
ncbi:tetratricopeptide repeat protein [Halocynthiibacter styelae]|uniref:Sulfotransferase family protein n=1 Tax=Halocynthiibacter styelae TaxID=2761955 RepID=A0A8J7LL23_9RHOB|nr:hypothetical protein [Paenihalocynthiibacter styelae]MBI1495080.1 hypothetical protein [Paenihalocynthiibacter styelae]